MYINFEKIYEQFNENLLKKEYGIEVCIQGIWTTLKIDDKGNLNLNKGKPFSSKYKLDAEKVLNSKKFKSLFGRYRNRIFYED